MSQTPLPKASGSSSNFQSIFHTALKKYKKKTNNDLLTHQLTARLQTCSSPSEILAVLDEKYDVQQFIQPQSGDETSKQWLNATVNVLCAFSAALGEGVGLVFSPAKVIFAGVGVLLIAAKDVGASNDALIDLFERIEDFFKRLETYTEVPLTEAMTDLITKIMAEVLLILAIATKEIKKGFARKYLRKLVGRTDIEDTLKRLDKLTQEEARMATAQVLILAHTVDNKMNEVIDVGRETRVAVGDLTRDQARKGFQEWLSPPDPTINYNTARDAYHDGTAAWFTHGNTFERWKASETLLLIHGKPGSGKSILSSAIIYDVQQVSNAASGLSYVAYFFFDFKDAAKQDIRALLSSLLVQLCNQSDPCFKILFDTYSKHDHGKQQPSEGTLSQCLQDMLVVSGQVPVYLIIDALDECPNTSKEIGSPRSRQKVLKVLKELVELALPNLHICITSRPEVDIQKALQQSACFKVSLHDEDGQKEDIANYVRSVVYSDEEQAMSNWGQKIKDLVIETLSAKSDGMFRWVVCQLEALRDCLGRNVERVLSELPKSLEETYERVLKGINEADQEDVYRLLQCLVVSIRPLRVEELAEVLAVDFGDAEGIPKLNPDWRWEDQELALRASCSSLIAIVDAGGSRIVQFSHFSVKEFLTSPRLACASGGVSSYHISLEPAHTIVVQACLSVLLRLDDDVFDKFTIEDSFPLTQYAAQHWVDHAQFKNVSSRVWNGMEYLFDPNEPYFRLWVRLHDIDATLDDDQIFPIFTPWSKSAAGPLYYASLCGFHNLAERLIVEHSQDVNASGGYYATPLVAALAGKHFSIAQLLHQHGADVNVRCYEDRTPLCSASYKGCLEIVQWLLSHGADASAHGNNNKTSLHYATRLGRCDMVRILLKHNADTKAQDEDGQTPLHWASEGGNLNVVRLLLEHGGDLNALDNSRSTPLHLASRSGEREVVHLLLERGASVEVEDDKGKSPFQLVSERGYDGIMRLLSERGAK